MAKLGPYELNSIITGDARELAKAIPDESVDLIISDPPYLKAFIPIYSSFTSMASRVLKCGGWLFLYGCDEHLPEYFRQMENKGLDYFWTFTLLHNGGYPRLWHKKLMSGGKPILIYTKGKPILNPWMSTTHTDSMDKRFHCWGQGDGFPSKIIDMLTQPNDIVLDFCCGGGTVPAVCKMLNRQYLAFEIDPQTADLARQRVANTQPPLPIKWPEQLALLEEA